MKEKLSLQESLMMMLCTAGALGILPFAIIRFTNGEWLIGALDAVLISGFLFLGFYVYRNRQVRLASISISVLSITGVLASVYLQGPGQVYWAFPALLAVYYLVRPFEAVAFSGVTIVALIPALMPAMEPIPMVAFFITLLITNAFAYGFASLTNDQRIQLLHLATKDPLTGAGNRRALDEKLQDVVAAHQRSAKPASMVLLDLDKFKEVNDEFGHGVGDRILIAITEIINLRIRVTDSLYRIGGEEFIVVVDGQDINAAARLAEQLRTLVEANELVPNYPVTISLGVAELLHNEDRTEWLRRTDEALYKAKRNGRNMTSLAACG